MANLYQKLKACKDNNGSWHAGKVASFLKGVDLEAAQYDFSSYSKEELNFIAAALDKFHEMLENSELVNKKQELVYEQYMNKLTGLKAQCLPGESKDISLAKDYHEVDMPSVGIFDNEPFKSKQEEYSSLLKKFSGLLDEIDVSACDEEKAYQLAKVIIDLQTAYTRDTEEDRKRVYNSAFEECFAKVMYNNNTTMLDHIKSKFKTEDYKSNKREILSYIQDQFGDNPEFENNRAVGDAILELHTKNSANEEQFKKDLPFHVFVTMLEECGHKIEGKKYEVLRDIDRRFNNMDLASKQVFSKEIQEQALEDGVLTDGDKSIAESGDDPQGGLSGRLNKAVQLAIENVKLRVQDHLEIEDKDGDTNEVIFLAERKRIKKEEETIEGYCKYYREQLSDACWSKIKMSYSDKAHVTDKTFHAKGTALKLLGLDTTTDLSTVQDDKLSINSDDSKRVALAKKVLITYRAKELLTNNDVCKGKDYSQPYLSGYKNRKENYAKHILKHKAALEAHRDTVGAQLVKSVISFIGNLFNGPFWKKTEGAGLVSHVENDPDNTVAQSKNGLKF